MDTIDSDLSVVKELNPQQVALFFNEDANHLMLISYCDEIVDFLNREMSLVR